jgi:hypothetical protein
MLEIQHIQEWLKFGKELAIHLSALVTKDRGASFRSYRII